MKGLLQSPARNLVLGVGFVLLVMAGAIGAYLDHGWSFSDALYMVVVTVFTVGYGEVRPIDTPELRAVTIILIVLGCTGMIFLTGALVQFITALQLQQFLGLKRMQGQIERLSGHVIICGFGRIGNMLARDLHAGGAAFVILEREPRRLAEARELGYLALDGDATDETSLQAAGIADARCLATVLPSDAANVFITLSARSLNRKLTIIARGEAPSTESKLLQAGANRVVLPTFIGAERIAEIILYPGADHILENAEYTDKLGRDLRRLGLEMEVVSAETGSRGVGLTVREAERLGEGAFLIVGLNHREGEHVSRPDGSVIIEADYGVVILGRPGRATVVSHVFSRQ